MDARKERLGPDQAMELTRNVSEVFAVKGKKIIRFHLPRDKPSRDDLLSVLLGPSGNLRAPTLRIGKKLLIGFDATVYSEVLLA